MGDAAVAMKRVSASNASPAGPSVTATTPGGTRSCVRVPAVNPAMGDDLTLNLKGCWKVVSVPARVSTMRVPAGMS